MAHFIKFIYVMFGVIKIVSLSSTEQNENGINDEIVGLIPPGLIAAKIRNNAIQEHLRNMARANLITHHHHPHMQLVPIFRDADEGNNFETNSVDSNTMRENVMPQDKITNPEISRGSANENPTMNQAIINDKPQIFRAMSNEDPSMIQTVTNVGPQTFRAMTMTNADSSIQNSMNDRNQMFRASTTMTNSVPTMVQTSMNDNPQMFRVVENPTMVKTNSNGQPQMFRAMTNEESTMVQAVMNDNPQMFRDMTNEDHELVQAMLSDNPQLFQAVSNDDQIMVQAMKDKSPQMMVSTTNDDQQKLRESTNEDHQILRANNGMLMILPNDSKMFRESENDNPQIVHIMENPQKLRISATGDQGMMMQSNGNSNMFRVTTNEEPQKLRESTNDQQILRADSGMMIQVIPNDSKMFRESENESPQVVHVMENPQSFRAVTTDNQGMIHEMSHDNAQLFRAFTDEDYFDMNDNGVTFMEQLPDDFLNFQAINDENEFRSPSTVMLINMPNENSQNAFRVVQNPIVHDPNVSNMKAATGTEKIANNQQTTENRSSMINETRSANETEISSDKLNRPTLSITGKLSDLQKAINRTLSTLEEARSVSSDDSSQSSFKPTSMYCITLNDKDLPQININSQRLAPPEDISPSSDANNASNHILPDQLRSQTFIADADLVIPLDNNNIEEAGNTQQFSENEFQHTITPIRILSPPVQQQPEIKHIPHVTPVHVISHGNNYGNQDYNRNSEARHIIKNNFVSHEFISPTSSINQFGSSFHRGFPSSQTFSQSSASASSFQNGGGFHRFIPSGGSSASAFAQSSGVSQQPFFNGFRFNDGNNEPIIIENNPTIRKSGFGVQPTIKAFRMERMNDPNQENKVSPTTLLVQNLPTHRLRKRSVTQNITSNSLIPIIQGIEDLFGDQNGTNNFMEPLKEVENFLEKHTINEKIQFEKDKNGEPIIKTELSTNFNPQELFNEFEEELPKTKRTKRTLALIHLLAKPSALNNDALGRSATPTEGNLPPIIHLRNALGSAGRAAVNVVETPLLGFILPQSFMNEQSLGDSQNPNFHQRLAENRQKTMQHYQNTIQSLGSAVQAHRQRNLERQNNSPVTNHIEENEPINDSQMVASESTQDSEIENVPQNRRMILRTIGRSWARMGPSTTSDSQLVASELTQDSEIENVPQNMHMMIRPIGRSWARMGFPTRRMFFIAEPFQPSQTVDQSDLIKSENPKTFKTPQYTPQIAIRKPNKKFKKVIHRQPTKFEPSGDKNVVVGSDFEGKSDSIDSSSQNLTSQSNLNANEEGNLSSSNPITSRNDNSTETNVMAVNDSPKSGVLAEKEGDSLITLSQCKEMKQNGEIKVKREENDVNDDTIDTEKLGTPNFTEFMKKPFGGLATQEQINNYISDTTVE